ncbi:Mss4-like protein [Kalaharituber pfeilii]|nr:Mss4-like protein [Kalaharituber pfeilii]
MCDEYMHGFASLPQKEYTGSCHCGLLTYSVSLPADPKTWALSKCNCSICHKTNFLSLGVWGADAIAKFTVLTPPPSSPDFANNVGDYIFNKKVVHHYFCKTCGVTTHMKGSVPDDSGTKELLFLNAGTIKGVDFSGEEMKVKGYLDGKSDNWSDEPKKAPIAPGAW